MAKVEIDFNYEKYGFKVPERYVFKAPKGLNENIIKQISKQKNEPKWMLEKRLEAFRIFLSKPLPDWGPDLTKIDFDSITYYVKPTDKKARSWDEVPKEIKETFERLGIPEAERKFLAGVSTQFESEVVYSKVREELEKQGVVFVDTDTGLKEYEDIFKQYFGKVVPASDNKFAALNTAVWSGGSFIYVPKGVKVKFPLQAYFRINASAMGQFERTLIVVEEGAEVHYIEGCTAPIYSTDSLHAAVVEIIAKKNAKVRYTTIQNWSKNVYNLVTKRAYAYENALVEWIDGNIGSKITMKYPSVYLLEEGAKANILSIAYAGKNQIQDAGAKVLHFAPNTSSQITSKSISKDGGKTTYRGLVYVREGAKNSKISVRCDALILDEKSSTETYPYNKIHETDITSTHEATVGKIGEDVLFYLMSRGLSEEEAYTMIVMGFLEEFVKELPLEYAVEFNRLIKLEMEGSVG